MRKTRRKIFWLLFFVGFTSFIVLTQTVGQIFFINRTESMPRGIYINSPRKAVVIGDIVVFHSDQLKKNLLKYVVAKSPAEFCVTDGDALFVDGVAVAKQNVEKYPLNDLPISRCQQLRGDEILVLGDHPSSYDSRYFGAIHFHDVVARVSPLWFFERR